MNRSLYLLRHAKSSWSAAGLGDHERPLKKRGVKAASLIGRFLTRMDEVPQRIVSSSAVRALTTVELAAEAGNWTTEIESTGDLYGADFGDLTHVVGSTNETTERLLVAGHEPSISAWIARLTGGSRPAVPTGTLARIDLATERWSELTPGAGELVWLLPARVLERLLK